MSNGGPEGLRSKHDTLPNDYYQHTSIVESYANPLPLQTAGAGPSSMNTSQLPINPGMAIEYGTKRNSGSRKPVPVNLLSADTADPTNPTLYASTSTTSSLPEEQYHMSTGSPLGPGPELGHSPSLRASHRGSGRSSIPPLGIGDNDSGDISVSSRGAYDKWGHWHERDISDDIHRAGVPGRFSDEDAKERMSKSPSSPSGLIGGLAPSLGYFGHDPYRGSVGSLSGLGGRGGRGADGSGGGSGNRSRQRSGESGRAEIGWRKYMPQTLATRLFLSIVLLETLVDVAIEADLLYRFNSAVDSSADEGNVTVQQNERILPVYLTIFGLAHIWQLVLAIDATVTRNTIQVLGLAIFNALVLAYAIIQVTELQTILGGTSVANGTAQSVLKVPIKVLTDGLIAVISIAEVGLVVLSYYVYREFGWEVFHRLGADLRIKVYFLHYQIFVCIIRFSAFFFIGFGVQFIFLILENGDAEYYLTIAALPASVALLILGTISAEKEWVWGMASFMFGQVAGFGYFVYKLVRIFQERNGLYKQIFRSMTVFASLSIVMLVLTFVWSCIVLSQFNKGLKRQRDRLKAKELAQKQGNGAGSGAMPGTPDFELEYKKGRMSID